MKPRDKQFHPVAAAVAWLATLVMFFPIFWMVLASFKTETQAIETPPVFIFHPTLQNYHDIFVRADYPLFAWNSVVISLVATAIMLVVAVPASFA
ncbi:MAG TPA: hypothetical protein VME47_00440, partial [Acetobacteraceae bacterium]|nr:hypothetical protein [Acetobacteraceae bacterium]